MLFAQESLWELYCCKGIVQLHLQVLCESKDLTNFCHFLVGLEYCLWQEGICLKPCWPWPTPYSGQILGYSCLIFKDTGRIHEWAFQYLIELLSPYMKPFCSSWSPLDYFLSSEEMENSYTLLKIYLTIFFFILVVLKLKQQLFMVRFFPPFLKKFSSLSNLLFFSFFFY